MNVSEALEGYDTELRARDAAEGTISLYASHLRRLAAAADAAGVELDGIGRDLVSGYLAGLGPVARNSALTAFRGFFDWAKRMHYIDAETVDNAIGGRKYKRKYRELKHYIEAPEFSVMLTLAEAEHPWHRAVLGVALYTLARESELAALKLSDLNLNKGEIRIYRQKRQRWTVQPIGPDLYGELDRWLAWYAEDQGYGSAAALKAAQPGWRLLPHLVYLPVQDPETGRMTAGPPKLVPGQRAARKRLEATVKAVLDALGVDGVHGLSVRHLGEGMHTIRRSGARAMADWLTNVVGADRAYWQVSIWLDHDNVQQTMEYIGQDIETARLHDLIRTSRMYGATQDQAPRRHLAAVP